MNAITRTRPAGLDVRAGRPGKLAVACRPLRRPVALGLMVGLGCVLAAHGAHAADTTGGGGAGLPWESPLNTLKQSFSGPVAFVVALLGIIVGGATLIWGGEVSEFARRMVYLVLVICILVFANTLLTGALFTGAMVPAAGLL